jgi:hypothetical protein
MDGLLIAFCIFAAIDLCFVGTTSYFVTKLVKRLLQEKDVFEQIVTLLTSISKKGKK